MDLNHQKSDQQIPAPDCALWIVWSRPHWPPPICWCVECTSSGSCPDGNGRKWCQENGHWLRFYQSLIEGIKHVPLVTKQNVLIRMPNGIWVNYVKNKMQTRGKSLKAHDDPLQSHSFPRFFWTIRNLYATQCNTLEISRHNKDSGTGLCQKLQENRGFHTPMGEWTWMKQRSPPKTTAVSTPKSQLPNSPLRPS